MASAIQRVRVDSKQALDVVITQYAAQGFVMVNKTEQMATMQKPKQFNAPIAIIGFLFCLVGLLIYLIVYSAEADAKVVQIVIEPSTQPAS